MVRELLKPDEDRLRNIGRIKYNGYEGVVEAQLHEGYTPDAFMRLEGVEEVAVMGNAIVELQHGVSHIKTARMFDDKIECELHGKTLMCRVIKVE